MEMRLDPSFPSMPAERFWVLNNGQVVVEPPMTSLEAGRRLIRINADGVIDPDWTITVAPSSAFSDVRLLPDGRTILTGHFTGIRGIPARLLAWLHPDGRVDSTAIPFLGAFVQGWQSSGPWVGSTAVMGDGGLLVQGQFVVRTLGDPPQSWTNLVRLRADGSVNPALVSLPNVSGASRLTECPDGSVLLWNGRDCFRFRDDGSLDLGFLPRPSGYQLSSAAGVQEDGRILVAAFQEVAISPAVIRLLPDGSLDRTFGPVTDFAGSVANGIQVTGVDVAPLGQIMVWGAFDSVQRVPQHSVALLTMGGVLSTSLIWRESSQWPPPVTLPSWAVQRHGRDLVYVSTRHSGSDSPLTLSRFRAIPSSQPPQVRLAVTSFPVAESVGSFALELHRIGAATAPALIRVQTRDGTAQGGADFGKLDASVEFAPGERNKRLAISVNADRLVETMESFRVDLVATAGAEIITPSSCVISIVDDDFGVELDLLAPEVRESEAGLVAQARLVGTNIPLPLKVRISTADIGAVKGRDYVALDQVVVFPNQFETTKAVSIRILDDSEVEPAEGFSLAAFPDHPDAGLAAAQAVVVTIRDDDAPDRPAFGADGPVFQLLSQSDGRILVAGAFDRMNGEVRRALARANPDGTLDPGFLADFNQGTLIRRILLQPDGRILALGTFTNVAGVRRGVLVRLLQDGSVDTDFAEITVSQSACHNLKSPAIHALELQSDGKILVGGAFDALNGAEVRSLGRLLPDGSLDSAFVTSRANVWQGACPVVNALIRDGMGRVVVGGIFDSLAGTGRNGMARLLPDGTPDADFQPQLMGKIVDYGWPTQPYEFPNVVELLAVQDGKILVYRDEMAFSVFERESPLVRLESSGALDLSFAPAPTKWLLPDVVHTLYPTTDDGVLVGGNDKLLRLNGDGTVDGSFVFPLMDWPRYVGYSPESNQATVLTALVRPSGEVWFGGNFTRLGVETVARLSIRPWHWFGPRFPSLYPPQLMSGNRVALIANADGSDWLSLESSVNFNSWHRPQVYVPNNVTRFFVDTPTNPAVFYRIPLPQP